MRKIQIISILVFGTSALLLEFRNIKEDAVLGLSMLDGIPLFVLCLLTLIFIYKNSVQFIQTRKSLPFVPALTGIMLIALVFGHKRLRSSLDDSPTLFTATNYNLGSDGGFILDFKTNNHLKAEKRDHWMVTYYWGSYKKEGDTFLLNIPLDFEMGKQAILQNNVLAFTDDTVHFEVFRE